MKRLLTALILLGLATNANAGFLTGYVVGRMTSGGSSHSEEQAVTVSSDVPGHDVIICMTYDYTHCHATGESREYTPAQFAGIAGYKVIYKTGMLMYHGVPYITMEVSK